MHSLGMLYVYTKSGPSVPPPSLLKSFQAEASMSDYPLMATWIGKSIADGQVNWTFRGSEIQMGSHFSNKWNTLAAVTAVPRSGFTLSYRGALHQSVYWPSIAQLYRDLMEVSWAQHDLPRIF